MILQLSPPRASANLVGRSLFQGDIGLRLNGLKLQCFDILLVEARKGKHLRGLHATKL